MVILGGLLFRLVSPIVPHLLALKLGWHAAAFAVVAWTVLGFTWMHAVPGPSMEASLGVALLLFAVPSALGAVVGVNVKTDRLASRGAKR